MSRNDTDEYYKEYADAAGLRPTDMPEKHHPLMENDDEVDDLSDLLTARENPSQDEVSVRELMRGQDQNLDVEDALTFPHKKRGPSYRDLPDVTDFDADARTRGTGDAEEDEYETEADFEDVANATDPDYDAGDDSGEFLTGARGQYAAPGLDGTVEGIARGTSTHLPQDLGPDGFQIVDPEADHDPGLDPEYRRRVEARRGHTDPTSVSPEDDTPGRDNLDDGGRIETHDMDPDTADDRLDGTRRLR